MNILAVARQGSMGGAAVIVKSEVAGCVEAPLNADDGGFPSEAVRDCLAAAHVEPDSLARVIWCGGADFEMPALGAEEAFKVPSFLRRGLKRLDARLVERNVRQRTALESLAAAAYFAAPFSDAPLSNATILIIPGGSNGGVHLWKGEGSELWPQGYLAAPHSPARLLDVFAHYLGLSEGRFAYDLAYLAAYGAPRYSQALLASTVDARGDGSFALKGVLGRGDVDASSAAEQLRSEAALPEIVPGQFDETAADLARSVVAVLRYLLGHLLIQSRRRLGTEAVCLAGDWVWELARHRLLPEDRLFQQAWVHPQRGAAALALGAALAEDRGQQLAGTEFPAVAFPFLGAAHSDLSIETFLRESAIPHDAIPFDRIPGRVAELVRHRHRVGWFVGREESGVGAAGHRQRLSMVDRTMLERLGDPRRTGLIPRPLTVCVLAEQAEQYFEHEPRPPFRSADAAGPRLCYWRRDAAGDPAPNAEGTPFLRRPLQGRGPALVLRVDPHRDPPLYRLLSALQERTGVPLMAVEALADESGIPARTPADAYGLLRANRLEALVLGNAIVLASADLPDLGTAEAIPINSWRRWSQVIERKGREAAAKVRALAEAATRRVLGQIASKPATVGESGGSFWRSYSR
jgi:predicted NodU family carbamoyl transferase